MANFRIQKSPKGAVLKIYNPITQGSTNRPARMDVFPDWRRSIRLNGGAWNGSFSFEASTVECGFWFDNLLGGHVEEISNEGPATWEGLIYQIDWTQNGVVRRRSLDDVFNAVKVIYINEDNEVAEETWITEDNSIGLYGRKEEIITMDGLAASAAEAYKTTFLARSAWPYPTPQGLRSDEEFNPELGFVEIRVAGYAYTTNWKFITQQALSLTNVSTWISDTVANDMQFVTNKNIQTNTTQVWKTLNNPLRAWDHVLSLTEIGDASGTPYCFYLDLNRVAVYEPIDLNSKYFWSGRELMSGFHKNPITNPFAVWPGVIQDMTVRSGPPEPGSFLLDRSHMLIEEIEVTDNGENVAYRNNSQSLIDIYSARTSRLKSDEQAYERWKDEKKKAKTSKL